MFVNIAFLAGIGAIAVPIVLHLIMRQKPKLLEFPALRFIQRRHDLNQRRLKLRHLLLLLLRAGAIAVLALALARPTIKFSSRFGSQEAPVAAAVIFDAGPHMQYRATKRRASRRPRNSASGCWSSCRRKARSPYATPAWRRRVLMPIAA